MCQTVHIADFDSQVTDDVLALIDEQDAFEESLFDAELLGDAAFAAELAAEEDATNWTFGEVEEIDAVALPFESPTANDSHKTSSAQAA